MKVRDTRIHRKTDTQGSGGKRKRKKGTGSKGMERKREVWEAGQWDAEIKNSHRTRQMDREEKKRKDRGIVRERDKKQARVTEKKDKAGQRNREKIPIGSRTKGWRQKRGE